MVKHPNSRREGRDSDTPEDAFVARILEYSAWARQNTRTIIIGALVVAVAVAGVLWYGYSREAARSQAAVQLSQIRQTVASGNRALAIRDLDSFVDRASGTPAGRRGRLILARLYLQEGRSEQAIAAAEPLADDWDDPLGASAASLLAAAYETTEALDEAEQVYLNIAENAQFEFQRRIALADAARVRQQQGDLTGAVELYERLIAMSPTDGPQRTIFEMRLAEVRARAQSISNT